MMLGRLDEITVVDQVGEGPPMTFSKIITLSSISSTFFFNYLWPFHILCRICYTDSYRSMSDLFRIVTCFLNSFTSFVRSP